MSDNLLAFPSGGVAGYELARGMDLRDWFAVQALNALVAGHIASHEDHHIADTDGPHVARSAYALADAMLAARKVQS